MKKARRGPVKIRFENTEEMVNIYYILNLKAIIMRLLYSEIGSDNNAT